MSTNYNIESYFSPSNKKKRTREDQSPGEDCIKKKNLTQMDPTMKVEDLTYIQLMESIKELLKETVTEVISKEIEEIKKENEEIKTKLRVLEERNNKLQNFKADALKKLEWTEKKFRERNLIFKGITNKRGDNYKEILQKFFSEIMKINARDITIVKAYPINSRDKEGNPHIIAEFNSLLDTEEILKKTRLLSGTHYYIQKDYSKEGREKRDKLFAIRREILKLKENANISVRGERLYVEGVLFLWLQEEGLCCGENKNAVEVLKELTGVNIGEFMKNLLEEKHLPIQQFKKNITKRGNNSKQNETHKGRERKEPLSSGTKKQDSSTI